MTTTTHNAPFARRTQNQNQNAQKAEPAKPLTVQSAPLANARKKPVTWKDLIIKYMLNGLDAVRSVLDESGDPVGALDKMIEEMGSGEQDTQELADLRDHYASLHAIGQPGRQPVKIGDVREYNVQQAGEEGDLFVRIPLNPFGVQRGMKVSVAFDQDQILITRIG